MLNYAHANEKQLACGTPRLWEANALTRVHYNYSPNESAAEEIKGFITESCVVHVLRTVYSYLLQMSSVRVNTGEWN